MKRKEVKYFFHKSKLRALLDLLKDDFNVLEIQDKRIQRYKSNYLDTSSRTMYLKHHNGHANRFKFRFREYMDNASLFFEVKHKQNTGITIKHRIPIEDRDSVYSGIEINKLLSTLSGYNLQMLPTELQVVYDRIGLIHKDLNARITLDQNVFCQDSVGNHDFENLIILELKFNRSFDKYYLMKTLRQLHLYPERISKYCISTCKLHLDVKQNRFKQKLRRIDQIKNYKQI